MSSLLCNKAIVFTAIIQILSVKIIWCLMHYSNNNYILSSRPFHQQHQHHRHYHHQPTRRSLSSSNWASLSHHQRNNNYNAMCCRNRLKCCLDETQQTLMKNDDAILINNTDGGHAPPLSSPPPPALIIETRAFLVLNYSTSLAAADNNGGETNNNYQQPTIAVKTSPINNSIEEASSPPKIRLTIRLTNPSLSSASDGSGGLTNCHSQYVVIDHVNIAGGGGRVALLEPLVVKLTQRPVIETYDLIFEHLVNSEATEQIFGGGGGGECDESNVVSKCGSSASGVDARSSRLLPSGFCCPKEGIIRDDDDQLLMMVSGANNNANDDDYDDIIPLQHQQRRQKYYYELIDERGGGSNNRIINNNHNYDYDGSFYGDNKMVHRRDHGVDDGKGFMLRDAVPKNISERGTPSVVHQHHQFDKNKVYHDDNVFFQGNKNFTRSVKLAQ